ncbi:MAG: zf-HC2 domain-containing protein [Acidobacteria bacterium]|nr:zf-HC2 domain-containing protein [Acidobacteriota bacterium]
MNAHDRTECRAVEDLLIALAAGELEAELDSQLRAHLDACADCRSSLAGIHRTQRFAAELKLASPELDRYPEFLRRLAASEAQAAKEIERVETNPQVISLAPVPAEQELAASATPQAGAAAVIPLFGNRLIVRSGFGRGFDLQISSRQNRELFRLSANSLAKAAAVLAGVGVFAATSLAALGLLVVWMFRHLPESSLPHQPEQAQQQPGQFNRPDAPNFQPQNLPWLQTVVGNNWTLAIWRAGNQVQAGFVKSESGELSDPFILASPSLDKRAESRITDCAFATDGQSFVVIREQGSTLFSWHLQPSREKPHSGISEPPLVIAAKAFQPAIAWTGDRYLVVWIEPDPGFPKLKLLELGRDGRPLQPTAMIVAETEDANQKVGTPGIVAQSGKALILYQMPGHSLMVRFWDSANGLSEAPYELLKYKGQMLNRPVLAATGDKFYLCWGENFPEGAELRLAVVNARGEVENVQTLSVSRTPLIAFDFKLSGEEIALMWAEFAAGGGQIFAKRFSVAGQELSGAMNVTPAEIPPVAFAFANSEGTAMVWHEALPKQTQLPVFGRRIEWKK